MQTQVARAMCSRRGVPAAALARRTAFIRLHLLHNILVSTNKITSDNDTTANYLLHIYQHRLVRRSLSGDHPASGASPLSLIRKENNIVVGGIIQVGDTRTPRITVRHLDSSGMYILLQMVEWRISFHFVELS